MPSRHYLMNAHEKEKKSEQSDLLTFSHSVERDGAVGEQREKVCVWGGWVTVCVCVGGGGGLLSIVMLITLLSSSFYMFAFKLMLLIAFI